MVVVEVVVEGERARGVFTGDGLEHTDKVAESLLALPFYQSKAMCCGAASMLCTLKVRHQANSTASSPHKKQLGKEPSANFQELPSPRLPRRTLAKLLIFSLQKNSSLESKDLSESIKKVFRFY